MHLKSISSAQARGLGTPHRSVVALSSSHLASSKRFSSLLCFSTSTETDRAGKSLEAVLLDVGIEASVLGSVKQRNPELGCVSVQERVEPLLHFLQQSLQLQPDDLRGMLLRCPRLLSFSMQRQVLPVVEFLRADLGFDQQQVAATLKRFPGIMGYGVKSHLVPHCHYLRSLGIAEEELPQLILARPQVLGASIELVITYLRKWLRIERTHVGRLLWSYPLDYSLPRLVLPSDAADAAATADSSMEEALPSDTSSNSSSSNSNTSASAGDNKQAAAGTASAASSNNGDGGSSVPGHDEEQQPQPQPQPRSVPLWGSPDGCSWLDIDLRKGGSSGSSSRDEDGGSSPSSPSGGGSSGGQPPAAA